MNRQKCLTMAQIALLRLINIVAIAAFAVVMEDILFNRLVLKWILIVAFLVVFTDLIESKIKQLKKSPRNGNSDRGHR